MAEHEHEWPNPELDSEMRVRRVDDGRADERAHQGGGILGGIKRALGGGDANDDRPNLPWSRDRQVPWDEEPMTAERAMYDADQSLEDIGRPAVVRSEDAERDETRPEPPARSEVVVRRTKEDI